MSYDLYNKIYLVAAQIPAGCVATYGDVATIIGGGCDARTVGYALGDIPTERIPEVPWQRVINREGGVSTRGLLQRQLLEAEGVTFDARDRVPLARFRWAGPNVAWATAHGVSTLPAREEGEQLSLF